MESGCSFHLWRTSTAQKICTQGRDSGEMPPFGAYGELKQLLVEHALFLLKWVSFKNDSAVPEDAIPASSNDAVHDS